MSNPLYAFPASCEQTLRALARYPARTAFSWPGGSITYQGTTDMIGRMQAVFMQLGFAARHPRRLSHRQPRRHLVRRRRRAIVAAGDHLAASAGLARRPAVSAGRFRSADAGGRRRHVPRSRRRTRRQGDRPENRLHARPGRLRRRSAAGDRERQAAPPRACFAGPDDIATLNYTGGTTGKSKGALRHHREQSGFANAILADFEIPDTPQLSDGGADQPCRRDESAADADARRHRAHAEGFRSRGGIQDDRARAHQFHAVRADDDLRHARSSLTGQDRPLLARTAAVWRLGDVAEPAGRGHRADRTGVLAALRPDRMLSGVGAAQGRPRSQNAGAVFVLRIPDRRLPGRRFWTTTTAKSRPARPAKSACARRM